MCEQCITFPEFLKKKKGMTLAEFWELPEFEQETIESIYNWYYSIPQEVRESYEDPETKWQECDGYGKPAHTCPRCHTVYSDAALFVVSGMFDFPEYCPHCGEHMYFINETRYKDEP